MSSIVKYIIIGLITIVLLFATYTFYTHLCRARTESLIAAIDYVIGRYLSENNVIISEDDIIKEVLKEYHDFKVQDGSLVDAWGNRISVRISESSTSYSVLVTSPGRDGIIDSIDDQKTTSRIYKRNQ